MTHLFLDNLAVQLLGEWPHVGGRVSFTESNYSAEKEH